MTLRKIIPGFPGRERPQPAVTQHQDRLEKRRRFLAAWEQTAAALQEIANLDELAPMGQSVMRGAIEGLSQQADVVAALAEKLATGAGA